MNSPILTLIIGALFVMLASYSWKQVPTYPIPPAKQEGYDTKTVKKKNKLMDALAAEFDKRDKLFSLYGE